MSDVEIKINGQNVDIDPEDKIAGTFQANDIGDLTKIKADVTSTIDMLDTPKNHDIMEHAAKLGSDSSVQLGEVSASVLFRGIPLMSNGRAMIKGVKGGYNLNIFGGNFDFIDNIRGKKLSDFDWSDYNFATNGPTFELMYNNTSGIVFPIHEYGKWTHYQFSVGSAKTIFGNGLIPWMFTKTIISEIITQSGFTHTGDMLNLPEYTNSIIALNPPPEHPLLFDTNFGLVVSDWMPDILAIDFIKSIMFQFGSYVSTIENKIYFIQFLESYKNQGVGKDWSDKYDDSQDPSIVFETGYAQNNLFKYPEIKEKGPPDFDTAGGFPPHPSMDTYRDVDQDAIDGEIVSDNKNLELEKTIVELPFEPSRWHMTEVQNLGLPTDVLEVWFPWLPGFSTNSNDNVVWQIDWGLRMMILGDATQKDSVGNTVNWLFQFNGFSFQSTTLRMGHFYDWKLGPDTTKQTTEYSLAWDELHRKYWYAIENSMLKNPTKVIARFNLSVKDIQDLKEILADGKHGAAIPVYVKQLNGHYFVNKISRFMPDRLTEVELIRL